MSAQVCKECTTAYTVGALKCPQCGAASTQSDAAVAEATVTVRCGNHECGSVGVERVVVLRLAAPGVVERPALHCAGCDWALETVPSNEEERDEDMPKITVHNGPSIEGHVVDPVTSEVTPVEEGGEDVSAGSSSETSSEKEPTSPEQSEQQSPSPARTTGSRSAKGRTAKGSSAPSTDGAPEAGTSETASADK